MPITSAPKGRRLQFLLGIPRLRSGCRIKLTVTPRIFLQLLSQRPLRFMRLAAAKPSRHKSRTMPDKVIDRDIFRCDCALWRNIVVVAEREARRRASVTVKLIRRRLAGPAIKQAALHGISSSCAVLSRRAVAGPIKARNPVSHPDDRTTPNFRRAARRARFERENRQAGGRIPACASLMAPTKPTSSARVKSPTQCAFAAFPPTLETHR